MSFLTDARGIAEIGVVNSILIYAGDALKWIITSAAIFTILIFNDLGRTDKLLAERLRNKRYAWVIPLHILCYCSFLLLTLHLFQANKNIELYQFGVWLALVLSVVMTYILWVTDFRGLAKFIKEYRLQIAIAVGGGLVVLLLSIGSRFLWEPLSSFTMNGSHALLQLFYNDLVIDVEQKYLGANQFIVHIAPVCSGVEGAILALGITCAYLYFSRDHFIFPRSLLLLPIAVGLSLLFNVVRVALLIGIGASVSEQIAVEGFHSVAGWISSVLIALLIIFVFSSWKQFQKHRRPHESTETGAHLSLTDNTLDTEAHRLGTAILLPFLLFMAATLIAGIFKQDFDYLYPLKLLLPLAALLWFIPTYRLLIPKSIWEPLGIGTLVAILWVLLVPTEPIANHEFYLGLTSMPIWLIVVWSVARLVGFWIFAPLAEELLFRCYLLNRLSGEELKTNGRVNFSILAFAVSSVCFGVLHAHWIAGITAGALFAIARYRSDSVSSPIVAHVVANVLVSIWAVSTQNWILL